MLSWLKNRRWTFWGECTFIMNVEKLIKISLLIFLQVRPLQSREVSEKSKNRTKQRDYQTLTISKRKLWLPKKSMSSWYKFLLRTPLLTQLWIRELQNLKRGRDSSKNNPRSSHKKPQPQIENLIPFIVLFWMKNVLLSCTYLNSFVLFSSTWF